MDDADFARFDGRDKTVWELQRSLAGISPKTLSERLQQLERDELVARKVFAEVPLHVEYSLTERGKSLQEIIAAMRSWGEAATVDRDRTGVEV